MYLKKRITNLSLKEFSIVSSIYIFMLFLLWIAGEKVNVNNIGMFMYIIYFIIMFFRDSEFIAEYSWIIVLFATNILGVYVCEEGNIMLVEQNIRSHYANTLLPLIISHIIFYFFIEVTRLSNKSKRKSNIIIYKEKHQNPLPYFITLIGIVVLVILFFPIIKTPYFKVGLSRIRFSQEVMLGWQQSLKSYLILFVPIAMMCLKRGKKIVSYIFVFLLVTYYFWTGDKFGAYFLLGYVILLCYVSKLNRTQIRNAFILILIFFVILLGIVYVQRVVLYDNDLSLFSEYLYTRLSNQGGVWWKMGSSYMNQLPHISEFQDEIIGILPGSHRQYFEYGQWKMMLVSGDYSSYSWYRVNIKDPYTATTTGSVLYYFGYFGVVIFYAIAGVVYCKIVELSINAFENERIFESIIILKIMISFHGLISASDLYILSYKGLVYIILLACLIYLRKTKTRIKIGKLYLT